MSIACNLCGNTSLEQLYTLSGGTITSLSLSDARTTDVWFCHQCGHTMTRPLEDLSSFYGEDYHIHATSEEEDQLLAIVDGKKRFRSDVQAELLEKKIAFTPAMRVLDFGCAKAATLKKIMKSTPINPFVFDVSHHYQSFWDGHFPPENQAVHTIPDPWLNSMDVVCSFFCIEHVADPVGILKTKLSLLKPGGSVFFLIPNLRRNVADMLVLDHINHFSPCALTYALQKAGFAEINADETLHHGWFVVTAKKPVQPLASFTLPAPSDVSAAYEASHSIATYWQTVSQTIAEFRVSDGKPVAIYGAGFYGAYAATRLDPSVNVACFIDQNSFLHGRSHIGKPILPPSDLPAEISRVIVAINPVVAEAAMASIDVWKQRSLTYEYLF